MFQSLRHSQLVLRICLAIVFLWFGIHKFIDPQYWIDAWLPQSIQALTAHAHVGPRDLIFLNGIFEVFVAISLASGFFMRWFAVAATLFLIAVFATHGFNEVLVRDIGLMGALVALAIWPERTYI